MGTFPESSWSSRVRRVERVREPYAGGGVESWDTAQGFEQGCCHWSTCCPLMIATKSATVIDTHCCSGSPTP